MVRKHKPGAKRLHNLLASEKWSEEIIKVFLWNEAKQRYEILQKEGEQVLVVWDGSVLEKPESQKAEDLCAVKSSKAARKKKSRKGSFNQPGGKPIVVEGAGMECMCRDGPARQASISNDGVLE